MFTFAFLLEIFKTKGKEECLLETKVWQLQGLPESKQSDNEKLEFFIKNASIIEASQMIQKGNVIAFPTETVYGLGANAFDDNAVSKIFKAKGRPSDNPLICHISKQSQLYDWIIPQNITNNNKFNINYHLNIIQQLIAQFWPGPLSIVIPYPFQSKLTQKKKHTHTTHTLFLFCAFAKKKTKKQLRFRANQQKEKKTRKYETK